MKIPFKVPIDLPQKGLITIKKELCWRLDDQVRIGDHLELEIQLRGEENTIESVRKIYDTIVEANPNIYEHRIEERSEIEKNRVLIFRQFGDDYTDDYGIPLDVEGQEPFELER